MPVWTKLVSSTSVISIQQMTAARHGRLCLLARSTCHGKGQEGGDKDNAGKGQEQVGLETFDLMYTAARGRGDSTWISEVFLVVIRQVLTLDQRANLLATIGNPGGGSLLVTHDDAIGIYS